jgi:2-succinyl-6-hydroxy-2,4-cyclohexadiene-1-carboxylate synthase
MTRIHIDGASYEVRTGGGGPPLLLIHGFTGRGSDWAPFLPGLQRSASTITVDLLGHGDADSPAEPARHAVERQAADLAAILRRIGGAPAAVVGYSMGARVALRMAVASGGVVARLMLESPSAGIEDPDDRLARREADEQLAHVLENGGIEAFVKRWESLPLFASERTLPAEVRARLHAARLRNRPEGLAASLRGAGQGSMEPLAARLGRVAVPTMVVAGELDETGRLRAEAVAAAIPNARFVIVEGVGHAAHREAPDRFEALLLDFVARSSAETDTRPMPAAPAPAPAPAREAAAPPSAPAAASLNPDTERNRS